MKMKFLIGVTFVGVLISPNHANAHDKSVCEQKGMYEFQVPTGEREVIVSALNSSEPVTAVVCNKSSSEFTVHYSTLSAQDAAGATDNMGSLTQETCVLTHGSHYVVVVTQGSEARGCFKVIR